MLSVALYSLAVIFLIIIIYNIAKTRQITTGDWIALLGIVVSSALAINVGSQPPSPISTPAQPTPKILVTVTAIPVTPSHGPTTKPLPDPIKDSEWCVYQVRPGDDLTLYEIVDKFLTEESDNPEFHKNEVFEATGGEAWQTIWADGWNEVPLPDNAQVALSFVESIIKCTDSNGRIDDRKTTPIP